MATLTHRDLLARYEELEALITCALAAIAARDCPRAILLSSAVVKKTSALDDYAPATTLTYPLPPILEDRRIPPHVC